MEGKEHDLGERTKSFARQIIRLYVGLPTATAPQILGRQTLRAGTSVGANYREAQRARSRAEFIAKVGDCLKEADETVCWLELLREENLADSAVVFPALEEANQLVAIFVTIRKHAQNNPAGRLSPPSSFFLLPS